MSTAPHPKHHPHGAERIVGPSPLRRSAEMNVTPLIDVLLVLLIIFMAAVPLTQQGLDVDLPKAAQTTRVVDASQIVAEYAGGRLTINKQPVPLADAEATFRDIFASRRDKTLFVIGEKTARYIEIIRIIDAAAAAGVIRIGIVTEEMRLAGR